MPTSDDRPRKRQSSEPYLPPPPSSREDSPELVRVPRSQPLPASLFSLVQGRSGGGQSSELAQIVRAALLVLVVFALAAAAYLGWLSGG